MTDYSPILCLMACDVYKLDHRRQYPPGTTRVYSNFTNRKSRLPGVDSVVHFGLQSYILKHLMEAWEPFFGGDGMTACHLYGQRIGQVLGPKARSQIGTGHIWKLHRLGYLPLRFCAVPEGTLVPIGVPSFTVENTHPDFAWLTNYVETGLSCGYWQASTSATIAHQYRKVLLDAAKRTGAPKEAVDWQLHDFSYRGMSSHESAAASGAAHLLSFHGTDSLVTLGFIDRYYGGDPYTVGSIPATEHSVMSAGTAVIGEFETYERLLDLYPTGNIAIVSDTYDLWRVLTEYLPRLKDKILARDGKVIIRPDSGDPETILLGDPESDDWRVRAGVVELLGIEFGVDHTDQGYETLDPHIGVIYGDSITLDRAKEITERLESKGFASTTVSLGVGSFCTHPDTLVLCDDLLWRKAAELRTGQGIIAFDEDPTFGTKGPSRNYRRATIEMNAPGFKDCVHILTDRGEIKVSTDHPFLVRAKYRALTSMFASGIVPEHISRRTAMRGPGLMWKKAIDLQPGDQIAFFGEPWETDLTRDGGWLAGLFDGEGSISKSTGSERIPAWKVNVSQNEGIVLQQAKDLLAQRGYTWYLNQRKCQQVVLNGGWREAVRFLGSIRPGRLLDKGLRPMVANMPKLKAGSTYDLATVQSVSEVYRNQLIASIRTSTRTFITNGFLSHNTYQYNTRDTFSSAMKATWAEIDGKGVDLFKDPVTDGGTKRSARGRLAVFHDTFGDSLELVQQATAEQEGDSLLQPVWEDGRFLKWQTFQDVRNVLNANQ